MPFQRLKGVHALAKEFSPSYQEGLRRLQNTNLAAREFGSQVGGGAAIGGLSGGISNYLAEGDMDHALRGALTGAMIGGVGGRVMRNANPLATLAVTGGVPAALAQVKDRPGISRLFRPESTDSISSLYSEERAFKEGTPEWNEYYAANPDRYDARYGQQKSANWKTKALIGAGLLGSGALGGALLTGESKEDFANRLDAEDEMIDRIDMGLASEGELVDFLVSRRDAGELAMPEDRYVVTTTLDKVKEASMSLNDIAAMEAMSGINVGRTRTKVGMIIDSNGVYTLYDESGKYTYGDFTKLSEAQEHAEKVAKFQTQWNPATNQYETVRKGFFGLGRAKQVDPNAYQSSKFTSQGRIKDFGRMQDAAKKTNEMNLRHFNKTTGAGLDRGFAAGEAIGRQQAQSQMGAATEQAQNQASKAKNIQQRAMHQARRQKARYEQTKATLDAERQAHQAAMQQQQQAAQNARQQAAQKAEAQLAAQTKKTTDATKALARWKRGTGIAGLTLGLGAAAYGAYNYFNKPKSWTERASGALDEAVGTMSNYQKYLPMANQFANTLTNVGGAANAAFNPYSARGGRYQEMPTYGYGGGYGGGYGRGY